MTFTTNSWFCFDNSLAEWYKVVNFRRYSKRTKILIPEISFFFKNLFDNFLKKILFGYLTICFIYEWVIFWSVYEYTAIWHLKFSFTTLAVFSFNSKKILWVLCFQIKIQVKQYTFIKIFKFFLFIDLLFDLNYFEFEIIQIKI